MKHKIISTLVAVLLLGSIFVGPLVSAQQTDQSLEQALQQQNGEQSTTEDSTPEVEQRVAPSPYAADSQLRPGTVVRPDDQNTGKVLPATQDKIQTAFGVVVKNNSPITITSNAADEQVYVATSGRQNIMVTSENGQIQAGDYLTVSALSGTLMKASDQELVFARALENFDGKNNLIGSTTLKDTAGNPYKEVGITVISATIEIMKNPYEVSTKADLPEQLQRLGQAIAEKEVSAVRIYLSLAIVTISIIVALATLYAGVRSSIISIGRNPLSKKSILRSLLEVILTAILVLIIGMFAVYLLLRL